MINKVRPALLSADFMDFFNQRVVRHWSSLSREAVDAPCLDVFKAGLDGALMGQVGGIPARGGGVGAQHDFPDPSTPSHWDSMIQV